jgi:hypothetical protein
MVVSRWKWLKLNQYWQIYKWGEINVLDERKKNDEYVWYKKIVDVKGRINGCIRVRNPRVTESLPATAVCEPLSEWTVRDDGVQQDKK